MKALVGRSEALRQAIRDAGYEVIDPQRADGGAIASTAELISMCRDVDVALSVNLPREAIAQAPRLRGIVTTSIGTERLDIASASEFGVLVCNSPSPENVTGVAESTVGLLVALSKRLKLKESQLRTDGWGSDSDRGILLQGRTLGLVGFGRIGSAVAQRLNGWGMRIIAHDPYVKPEIAANLHVELVDLPSLFRESDFVSVHLTVNDETRSMIDETYLRLMKPQAFLINTSRGQVIDEPALEKALQEEWFAGAALDVYHSEPLNLESPLRNVDPTRLILTPHSISHTLESQAGGRRLGIESTLAILRGEVPENVVNPEVIPGWRKRFGDLSAK